MATIPEAFAIAVQHHQGGRLQAAEQICRQIVEVDPDHAEALHLLGLISAQAGNSPLSVAYIKRALAVKPDWAVAHASLGNVFSMLKKQDDAVACYLRALQLKPDFVEAHCNLASKSCENGTGWMKHSRICNEPCN